MPITKTSFIIAFLVFCQMVKGQNKKIDSLSEQSFEILEKYFDKQYSDSITDIIYAKAILKKAIKLKDTFQRANAYYFLSDIVIPTQGLKYCDSLINLTSNLKDSSTLQIAGYLQKGNIYYNLGMYTEALNFSLKCYELSSINNNNFYLLISKQNIGLIKNKIGEREEALEIFKSYVHYLEGIEIEDKDYYLINGFYCLADSYVYNKKKDSASLFINKGLTKAINAKNSLMHAHYVYLSGVNSYFSKSYYQSIDSLLRSQLIFKDETLNASANLYLGKSYYALSKKEIGVKYFIKVDSFLQKTQNITPEFIEAYQPLIEWNKDKNDLRKQVYYINSLLKFDSILGENNKHISKKIIKNYDIPILIFSKNKLINELKKKNITSKKHITLLIIISILFSVSTVFYIRRSISNKKKFNTIINSQNTEKKKLIYPGKILKASNNNMTDISDEIIKDVLKKLEIFENKNIFIKNYTLASLAKELKTNSSYLSKIINSTKECNFSNYINNLRLEYAINKLTNDKIFRSYTIIAIANDCGFNTAQSFSNAFYKKTGLKPSYFIKQIEKQKKSDNQSLIS